MALKPMVDAETPPELVEEGAEIEIELVPTQDEKDELELNPNVEGQLDTASDEGIAEEPEETTQQKYDAFMTANPEARDIHGKKTEKRIAKMTWENKEAQRLSDEAIAFAQRSQDEITKLKSNQIEQDGAFITEHKGRIESQLAEANREYQQATNLSDSAGMADATQKMARLTNQLDTANNTEVRFNRAKEQPVEQPVYKAPQPAKKADVHPKAKAWADEHEWFGEDEELTKSALTIHKQLVTQDGYIPNTDAYYTQLNDRMKMNYPDNEYFKTDAETTDKPTLKTPTAVVTGGHQSVGRTKAPKISLTSSQVQLAKRLGVPLGDYAKSLADYKKDA
jgi:hypothetical protein